jgi:peptidoglycan/LPS O-acetylase OafA/YrhL
MGALRFLLAVSVLTAHLASYPKPLPHPLHPDVAVQGFYCVSGFLITLVLREKYASSILLFYSNRALRIFPIYWIALIVYLIANLLVIWGFVPQPPPALIPYQMPTVLSWVDAHGHELGYGTAFLILNVNLFIFGQDLITFVHSDGGWSVNLFYHYFMIIRVAWTLAIELCFYLIAPFIAGRIFVIVGVLMASLAAQLLCYFLTDFSPDWYSRVFPFALVYFMAGSLSYYAYTSLRKAFSRFPVLIGAYSAVANIALLVLTFSYPSLPYARATYLTAMAICLPGIVLASRRNPMDKIMGDLSYPLYLVHPLFLLIVLDCNQIVVVVGSLAIAWAIVYFVERPLDRLRQGRARSMVLNNRTSRHVTGPELENV